MKDEGREYVVWSQQPQVALAPDPDTFDADQ